MRDPGGCLTFPCLLAGIPCTVTNGILRDGKERKGQRNKRKFSRVSTKGLEHWEVNTEQEHGLGKQRLTFGFMLFIQFDWH